MNTDYTALALVIDRSGSMHSVAGDTVGSVQNFISSQKKQDGKATLTMVQFDHEYEVLHRGDLQKADEHAFAEQYSPRGSTALLDAIGRTTIDLSAQIESMEEAERPARVVVAIITDGYENASTDFTATKIRELIKEKEALGWDFIFMGATMDTMTVAQDHGFSSAKSAYYEGKNVTEAFSNIDVQVTNARQGQEIAISDADRVILAGG